MIIHGLVKECFHLLVAETQISKNLNKLDFFFSLNIKIVEVDGLELVLQLHVSSVTQQSSHFHSSILNIGCQL